MSHSLKLFSCNNLTEIDFDTTDLIVYKFSNKFEFSEYEIEFNPTIREHYLRVDFQVRYQMNKNKRIDVYLIYKI